MVLKMKSLFTTGLLPLIVFLLADVGCQNVQTVGSLNLTQYKGAWYQMYSDLTVLHSYQNRALCVKVNYQINDEKTLHLCESFRKYSPYAPMTMLKGMVIQPSLESPGNLKKQFDRMPYPTPYLVIKLGPVNEQTNQYEYSIVTDPNKGALYIYARDLDVFRREYKKEVLEFCEKNGFDRYYNEPKETPQPPPCYRHHHHHDYDNCEYHEDEEEKYDENGNIKVTIL